MDDRTKKRAKFLIDAAYIAAVALLVYLAFKFVMKWILPFILAFCLVAAVHPIITRVVRRLGIKQEIVSVIFMILIYTLVAALLFFLIWQAIFTIRDAFSLLPGYYETAIKPTLETVNGVFADFVESLPGQWRETALGVEDDIMSAIRDFLIGLSQKVIGLFSSLSGGLPAFMIAAMFTVMLSFFISLHYNKVIGFIKTQLPSKARRLTRDTRVIILETALKYLKATLTLMIITFCETAAGLLLLGRKNAIPIAAGIAICDALPVFGTGTIVIPWILIELIQGNFTLAAGLALMYAIISFVRSIIEPKIVGDKLGLNPVVSLVSIYLGYKVLGVFGMIIMPIITQIGLELHRKGTIKLFREPVGNGSSES